MHSKYRLLELLLVALIIGSSRPAASLSQAPGPLSRVFNVRAYGAQPDGHHTDDGVMQAGSTVLKVSTPTFSRADVGKPIHVIGAGPLVKGGVDPLRTVISAVKDETTVILADPARTSISNSRVSWGTDDYDFIQNAINAAAAAGGGTVYLPAGIYRTSMKPLMITASNIRLTGEGNRSEIFQSDIYTMAEGGPPNQGDGKSCIYVGVKGKPISNIEIDHIKLANSGTQVRNTTNGVGLIYVMDNTTVNNYRLHDLAIETSSRCGITQAATSDRFEIYNNQVTGGLHAFYITGLGSNGYVHDNHLANSPSLKTLYNSLGIDLKSQTNCRVVNNTIEGYVYGIMLNDHPQLHILVDHNTILNTKAAIYANQGVDMTFSNNTIEANFIELRATAPIDTVKILNNTIRNAGGWAIKVSRYGPGTIANVDVVSNRLIDCAAGIQFLLVGGSNTVSDNTLDASHIKGIAAFDFGSQILGKTTLMNNVAIGYQKPSQIPAAVVQSGNQLR